MPLDPQAQAVLDLFREAGIPPSHTLPVAEARAGMIARAAAAPGQPEAVARIENRTIPGPDGEIPIRIYTPEGQGPWPVLVYFHGGGWVLGNLDTHDRVGRSLANRADCVVVSVDYRLAPEHRFPAAPEDAYAATRWAADNAAAFGGDGRRLAVAGDSAGGNLAAVVALMARDRGGPELSLQVLVYPVTDHDFDTPSYLEHAEGLMLWRAGMIWFWDHYAPEAADRGHPHASPLRAESLAGLPPALVITAEYDPLRDEGEAYAARLREAGVPVVLRRYPGMIHGFFGMAHAVDLAREAIDEAGRALREAWSGVWQAAR
jgi:acetyl esterase